MKDTAGIDFGAGFFLRQSDRLFFITALHVMSGAKHGFVTDEKDRHMPDTMYVRINYSNPSNVIKWPIDTRKYRKLKPVPYSKNPDLCIYEFKKPYPSSDQIYSIETLIDINVLNKKGDVGGKVIVYGNPMIVSSDTLMNPIYAIGEGGFDIDIPFEWGDHKMDSVHYLLTTIRGSILPGYSGSPIFLRVGDSDDSGHFAFFGVCIGDSGKTFLATRPLILTRQLSAK